LTYPADLRDSFYSVVGIKSLCFYSPFEKRGTGIAEAGFNPALPLAFKLKTLRPLICIGVTQFRPLPPAPLSEGDLTPRPPLRRRGGDSHPGRGFNCVTPIVIGE